MDFQIVFIFLLPFVWRNQQSANVGSRPSSTVLILQV